MRTKPPPAVVRTAVLRRTATLRVQTAPHDVDRVGVGIDEHEVPTELPARGAERAAARKEVQAPALRSRRRGDDPAHHGFRLLRRVAGLLLARRVHDRRPPDRRRHLAARGLLGPDEPGRHVRLAFDLGGVEPVLAAALDVDEDRVVLGRPAVLRPAAVVVGPDQLVEEVLLAEELVEQQLDPVGLAVVEVYVERAVAGQKISCTLQFRAQKAEIVSVGIRVGKSASPLGLAGVERRIDVDEIERRFRQAFKDVSVVGLDDEVVVELETLGEIAAHDAHGARPYRAYRRPVLQAHPKLAAIASALLAVGALVALLGAEGLLAAALGTMAWFALPERHTI